MYYTYNRDTLPFRYVGEELRLLTIIDEKHHKEAVNVHTASNHISAPKTTHKKNLILLDGYLDLLLFEAKKYEPDITLGIALGAYAGLREGEIVNVSCGAIKTHITGSGKVSLLEIDLNDKAPYFKNWSKKTNPGTIKKNRTQMVYTDFTSDINDLYEYHMALMEIRGFDD